MELIDQEHERHLGYTKFLHNQTASGVILLIVSVFAFYLANSDFWEPYNNISHTHLSLNIGEWHLDLDINHWVNEGLMVLFFFLVGLEIKREILVGELSSARKAALPVVAAIGGMIVPALIYSLFNVFSPETRGGWGVPMATDIAFVIAVLSILGKRVPVALKVFLTCLAIVDDLGAILVIALFYTEQFHLDYLLISFIFVFLSAVYGRFNGGNGIVYSLLCVGCWYFMLESGIHSTIAGVLMAMTIPIKRRYSVDRINKEFKDSFAEDDYDLREHHLDALERVIKHSESPLSRFEHILHPWVGFLIMPLFAFFNAGVHLPTHLNASLLVEPHALGIFLGLLMGKPLGVLIACRFAVLKGWASLPTGVGWRAMIGVSYLAGLGFTMSLFISVLAFEPGTDTLEEAKLAILVASICAMLIGAPLTWIGLSKKHKPLEPQAVTA
ncbi:Na+/H+ antiporter NhaA [Kiritimatiellota bacterium B12222]|nr:Na+/H+ antiporter NhaA [Kiritimatiellota bacterium B12222]